MELTEDTLLTDELRDAPALDELDPSSSPQAASIVPSRPTITSLRIGLMTPLIRIVFLLLLMSSPSRTAIQTLNETLGSRYYGK